MRRIPFEIWLAALVLAVHVYVVLLPPNSLLNWFTSDDAFYYFKTAQNIAEGRGVTFDGLGRESGFHPLWMAVLVPVFSLARLDLILPLRLVVFLSALFCAGTAVLLYRLAKRFLHPLAAAFIGLFWAFHPLIHNDVTELGLESGLSAFLIALLVYRVAQEDDARDLPGRCAGSRSLLLTGAIAALTLLARLDNIFLVGILGIWVTVRPLRLRYLLVGDIFLIGLGVLWSYLERVGFGPQYAGYADSAYGMVVAALALRLPLYYFIRLYYRPAPGWRGLAAHLARAAVVSLLASVALSAVMWALSVLRVFPGFPRLVLAYEAGFALAALLLTRLAAAWITRRSQALDAPLNWATTITRLAAYFAPVGLALVMYMGWSLWYFGTPSPVSGQIKRWWGTLPSPIYGRPVETLRGMLGWASRGDTPWKLLRGLLAWPAALPESVRLFIYGLPALALLLWQWARTGKAMHRLAIYPLIGGGLIQIISYTGTGYLHMRGWYWAAQMMITALLLGILIDACLHRLERSGSSRTAAALRGLVIVLCGLLVLSGVWNYVRRMPVQVSAENTEYYLVGIRELEENTEPGSLVGSTGGGIIAYFVRERTIVNLDGLMNTKEYFQMLKAGTASQYLDAIGLDYVFSGENVITDSDPYFQFKDRLRKLKDFGGATLFKWE